MNSVAVIFWFVVIAVAVITAIAKHAKQRNANWQRLAQSYGGRMAEGGWFGHPAVRFERGGQDVLVDVYSTGGKNSTRYTQVHLHWPNNLRMEVYPKGFFARIGLFLGMQDINTGSSYFDEHFIVRGSDADEIRRVLAADVQQSIIQLRDTWYVRDIYVRLLGGKLLVKKRGYGGSYNQLRQLTELALELQERALGAIQGGMDFDGDAAQLSLQDAVCQICGSPLGSDVVYCRRCKTPHHRDCWSYYGACSTYGCGETWFVKHPLGGRRHQKQKVDA